MLKHAKNSTAGASSDPAKVGGDDWNADHLVDDGGILMNATPTVPSTPAAGKMTLWGRVMASRALPASIGPNGMATFLQPYLARNKISLWAPLGNTNTSPVTAIGIVVPTFSGTATARNVAAGNLLLSMKRIGAVSAATAGSVARANATQLQFWRGNGAGLGGFTAVFRWGCSDAATVAGARTFVGFASTAAVGNVDPSSLTNCVGIGTDGGDTNLQIIHNDGSGTATKIDLGASFPDHTLSMDAYELALFCAPNGSDIGYEVTRLNTGDAARGILSTNLPVNTQLLCPQFMRNNNATALAVGIDIVSLYIETDN